ncbi:glycoside hydrolase family 3 N-terminal domain-containing protein [Candidatus Omnitrophota bacterium]
MSYLILSKLKARVLILALPYLFLFFFPAHAKQASTDIIIFSPHPGVATLCCGGTILKAVKANKKIKVVFLTNGEGRFGLSRAGFNQNPEALSPNDYIARAEEFQKQALSATNGLGLDKEDIIFLSYPDNGLSHLWQERYEVHYNSDMTRTYASAYRATYNRAKQGYTKENMLFDIKDILQECKPRTIYLPHPLDNNPDYATSTDFVNLALEELEYGGQNGWTNQAEILYYFFGGPEQESPYSYVFSQEPNYKEDIVEVKEQKINALREYLLMDIKEMADLETLLEDNELFWYLPSNAQDYLKQLEHEWASISRSMQRQGYNINFAPVVDVADDIEDTSIPLARKKRIYSQDPDIVAELAYAVIKGMAKGGITPVLKHFPGLGHSRSDSHVWLPEIKISKKELLKKDFLPFMRLIKEPVNFWIMIGHAIYPDLKKELASLSRQIQTGILREELGFKGIIIVDELLVMQAVREYALQQEIKEPYIGEIVVRAFQAGADIAIFYVKSPQHAKETISSIIKHVKKAIEEGRIKQEDLDASLARILAEKERIFGKPLSHLLRDMTVEEKITQKLISDVYCRTEEEFNSWREVLSNYTLSGIHARDPRFIDKFQESSRIPMFITGQHEGGLVNQYGLNLYTRSAYLIGKEFERLGSGGKLKAHTRFSASNRTSPYARQQEACSRLDGQAKQSIIDSLVASQEEIIALFLKLHNTGYVSPNPNDLSPVIIHSDGRLEIKPFEDLPIEWLSMFSNQSQALCAYQLFKKAFEEWLDSQRGQGSVFKNIVAKFSDLKNSIRAQGNKGSIRVLCLAAHPDDEDGQALAYLKRKLGCSSYILLATRGEAGENELNQLLDKELGFLRTDEMERAASILGVNRVYYLGKHDFGYCRNPQEAFTVWGQQDTLERLVYFYRLIKPHIIITKHNKFNADDHCQHQALVILAEQAFDLAGDPAAYPEMQEQGLLPWQPLKFYQRRTGQEFSLKNDTDSDTVTIDVRQRIQPEDKTISQIALDALRQHRSQGDWQWLSTMYKQAEVSYQLAKSSVPVQQEYSFLDGIQTGLSLPVEDMQAPVPSGLPGVKIATPLRIGLVEENNNLLFIALKTLGCDFESLDADFLNRADLSQFDTIVLGQGVYSSDEALVKANNKHLLKFVKNGGNLIVFAPAYLRKQPEFSYAPYRIKMEFNPVTDEDAKIVILKPGHSLFNFPNKITALDFDGWLQDRGLSFAFEYSSKYTELISCFSQDIPLKGGYLIARYGRGSYIFTTYSWHRQLRDFHLGAYKNFANMLAFCYNEQD